MKHTLLKVLLLAAMVCLLFALPALAEAVEHNRTAGTEAELQAAVALANELAADVAGTNTLADWVNITITGDIALNQKVSIKADARVRISSAAGSHYTISSTKKVVPYFYQYNRSQLVLSGLTFDGMQNASNFLVSISGTTTLQDGCIIENFRVSSPLVPVMWGVALKDDPTPAHFIFRDCIVRNNASVEYSSGIIYQSSPDGSVMIDGCTFTGNSCYSVRGTVQATGSLSATNSTFSNNSAIGGGAIFFGIGDLSIDHCDFLNNAVGSERVSWKEGGGALHIQQCEATITNCNFIGNSTDLSGGAVHIMANATVSFADCVFRNNVAETHSGAITVCDAFSQDDTMASHITLTNCLLEGNKANGYDGDGAYASSPEATGAGALYLHEYCTATLGKGTVIRNNYARDCGGAAYVAFGGRLTIDGAEIYDNHADVDGGGIYVDGADAYAGYDHSESGIPTPDDGFATGGKLFFKDGIITGNTAGRNGGGVYIGGENEVIVDGEQHIFTGGEMQMTGGVLTENTALDMGGGVYVGACDTGEKGGILDMRGGAIYLNVAGENGNTSDGADDAGADVYSEGGNAYITVVTADRITAYIRNAKNTFVPADHRDLYFTNWYDDYSDQDPTYGKMAGAGGVNTNTGRYKSSVDPHRVVYTPRTQDAAHNALILDYDRVAEVPVTGDSALPLLWLGLCLLSAVLLKRRTA